MYLTIYTILGIPAFKNCKVIAGSKGLNRFVEGVTFVESPDSFDWVQKNDFLITNAYFIKQTENRELEIIKLLHKKNVAGIGIKLKRHLNNIDQNIINLANKLPFPVISLSYELTPSQIINAITEKMHLTNYYLKNICHNLIFSQVEKNTLLNKLEAFGFSTEINYGLLVVETDNIEYKTQMISMILELNDTLPVYFFDNKNEIIILYKVENKDDKNDIKNQLFELGKEILVKLSNKYPSIKINIGIGRFYNIEHLNISYLEAKKSIELQKITNDNNNIIHFDDLGIYRLLSDLSCKEELLEFHQDTVGKLIDYDKKYNTNYFMTVNTLIENNFNIKKTAEKLFLHYNSVKYRIEKIKQLGIDLSNPDKRLNLQLGFKISEVYGIIKEKA